MKNILGLLLAGGDSTRIWPFAEKHLIPFSGKTLLERSLDLMQKAGVGQIVVVANKDNYHLFRSIQSNESDYRKIKLVIQKKTSGMSEAILAAETFLKEKQVLIISPSDVIEESLYTDLMNTIDRYHPDGIITGTTVKEYFPGGYLSIKDELVTDIIEKPDRKKLPGKIVKLVFDYFNNTEMLIKTMKTIRSKKDDVYEKSIVDLIAKNCRFRFQTYKGFWGYLKYPWHILLLNSYFLKKIAGQNINAGNIDHTAKIIGQVHIGKNARILENTKIIGPSFIGSGTIIGNNSIIREATIGNNCVVGYNTEVVRSHIGNNCWFHSNYIGDSVICDNVSLGAGTTLANFRLDESSVKSIVSNTLVDTNRSKLGAMIGRNVRIGINTSVMPGVKIGKNSLIGAGVYLNRDLAEGKICQAQYLQNIISQNKKYISSNFRSEIIKSLRFF